MQQPTSSILKKLAVHFIVFALLVVFLGKAFFVSTDHLFLYLYGALVTFVLLVTFFFSMWRYLDPVEVADSIIADWKVEPEKPLVSCMVSVYNEEEFVGRCLDSLLAQDYPNKEIIVVNDCSTDGTAAILDEYHARYDIRVIHMPENVGKKRGLGQAVRVAQGSILAFTDSDSVWRMDALGKAVKVFQTQPYVGGLSGHSRALNADDNLLTKIQDSWYEGQFAIRKAFESIFGAVTCISGPMAVFRREAIVNYIPAWEQDAFLGQEFRFATDRTMTGFLLAPAKERAELRERFPDETLAITESHPEREWEVVYAKSVRSWTVVPNSFLRVLRQQIRWKKSFIRNIFFTGRFYWRKPMIASLFYYLHVLFVLAGPFIAFRHVVYLPLRGDAMSLVLYLSGILFVGLLFGVAYKLENPRSHIWVYRPLMSLFSTLCLSWLLFYSAFTIKKMTWQRG